MRGTTGAIGLQHVTIDFDLNLTQGLKVNEPAMIGRSSAEFLGATRLFALASRSVRLSVARGSTLYSAVTHPRPGAGKVGRDHLGYFSIKLRIPALNQTSAFGIFIER